jgi:hypothetical protein
LKKARRSMVRRFMAVWAGAALLTLALASPAHSGTFHPQNVPSDVKWVAHLDAEACRDSHVMRAFVRECLGGEKLQKLSESSHFLPWSVVPLDQIQSITLFGSRLGMRNGVAVVQGKWDRDELVRKFKSQSGVKMAAHGEHATYSWTEHKGEDLEHVVSLAFPKSDFMVFGSGSDLLNSALDVIDGKSASLEGKDSALTAKVPDGTVFFARAAGLKESDVGPHLKFFRLIEGFNYVASEHKGRWTEELTATATTEKVAKNLQKAMEGLVAMEALCLHSHSKLADLMDGARFTRDGRQVRCRYEGDADELARLIKPAGEELRQQWQSRLRLFHGLIGHKTAHRSGEKSRSRPEK